MTNKPKAVIHRTGTVMTGETMMCDGKRMRRPQKSFLIIAFILVALMVIVALSFQTEERTQSNAAAAAVCSVPV